MDRRHQSDSRERRGSPLQLKWLGDLDEPDRDRFGSKSVNLALLARRGLPVPDGFAVAFEEGRSGILSAEEKRVLTAAYSRAGRKSRLESSRGGRALLRRGRGRQGVLLCRSVRDVSRCDR